MVNATLRKSGISTLAILSLCALLFFSNAANSEYVVAFPNGDYYPQYSNTNGQMEGFLPDLLQLFSNASGHDLRLEPLPIKRYIELLHEDKIDFILPSNPAWIDNKYGNVLYSDVVMISRSGFVRRSASKGATVKRVATVQGYTLPVLEERVKDKDYSVNFTVDTYASLEMLRRQRVDSVYAHLDIVKAWVRKNSLEGFLYFEPNLSFDNYAYHLATIKHEDVLKEFNRWLASNRLELQELMKKYQVGSESLID